MKVETGRLEPVNFSVNKHLDDSANPAIWLLGLLFRDKNFSVVHCFLQKFDFFCCDIKNES